MFVQHLDVRSEVIQAGGVGRSPDLRGVLPAVLTLRLDGGRAHFSLRGMFGGVQGRNGGRQNTPKGPYQLASDPAWRCGAHVPGVRTINLWASHTCGCLFIQQTFIQSLLHAWSLLGSRNTAISKTNRGHYPGGGRSLVGWRGLNEVVAGQGTAGGSESIEGGAGSVEGGPESPPRGPRS